MGIQDLLHGLFGCDIRREGFKPIASTPKVAIIHPTLPLPRVAESLGWVTELKVLERLKQGLPDAGLTEGIAAASRLLGRQLMDIGNRPGQRIYCDHRPKVAFEGSGYQRLR
jgi:hypothetical protein